MEIYLYMSTILLVVEILNGFIKHIATFNLIWWQLYKWYQEFTIYKKERVSNCNAIAKHTA